MKKTVLTLVLGYISIFGNSAAAQEYYLGEIRYVAFNFAPVNWHECDGSLMSISQNQALFSLLGTTYGGNGVTTFALPDIRGRVLVGAGTGPNLSSYVQGEEGGQESHILLLNEIPAHIHSAVVTIPASTKEGNANIPTNAVPANTKLLDKEYSTETPDTTMMSVQVQTATAGGSQPHDIRQPYIAMKCIIAVQGIYPSHP
ncbi:phage tail protein [Daejeonia sp. YH14]|uniref:phage tail protein n=1 Tax=Daejeonia sp. YH14 TaxID=3439042 RepID=UPI003F4960D3